MRVACQCLVLLAAVLAASAAGQAPAGDPEYTHSTEGGEESHVYDVTSLLQTAAGLMAASGSGDVIPEPSGYNVKFDECKFDPDSLGSKETTTANMSQQEIDLRKEGRVVLPLPGAVLGIRSAQLHVAEFALSHKNKRGEFMFALTSRARPVANPTVAAIQALLRGGCDQMPKARVKLLLKGVTMRDTPDANEGFFSMAKRKVKGTVTTFEDMDLEVSVGISAAAWGRYDSHESIFNKRPIFSIPDLAEGSAGNQYSFCFADWQFSLAKSSLVHASLVMMAKGLDAVFSYDMVGEAVRKAAGKGLKCALRYMQPGVVTMIHNHHIQQQERFEMLSRCAFPSGGADEQPNPADCRETTNFVLSTGVDEPDPKEAERVDGYVGSLGAVGTLGGGTIAAEEDAGDKAALEIDERNFVDAEPSSLRGWRADAEDSGDQGEDPERRLHLDMGRALSVLEEDITTARRELFIHVNMATYVNKNRAALAADAPAIGGGDTTVESSTKLVLDLPTIEMVDALLVWTRENIERFRAEEDEVASDEPAEDEPSTSKPSVSGLSSDSDDDYSVGSGQGRSPGKPRLAEAKQKADDMRVIVKKWMNDHLGSAEANEALFKFLREVLITREDLFHMDLSHGQAGATHRGNAFGPGAQRVPSAVPTVFAHILRFESSADIREGSFPFQAVMERMLVAQKEDKILRFCAKRYPDNKERCIAAGLADRVEFLGMPMTKAVDLIKSDNKFEVSGEFGTFIRKLLFKGHLDQDFWNKYIRAVCPVGDRKCHDFNGLMAEYVLNTPFVVNVATGDCSGQGKGISISKQHVSFDLDITANLQFNLGTILKLGLNKDKYIKAAKLGLDPEVVAAAFWNHKNRAAEMDPLLLRVKAKMAGHDIEGSSSDDDEDEQFYDTVGDYFDDPIGLHQWAKEPWGAWDLLPAGEHYTAPGTLNFKVPSAGALEVPEDVLIRTQRLADSSGPPPVPPRRRQ